MRSRVKMALALVLLLNAALLSPAQSAYTQRDEIRKGFVELARYLQIDGRVTKQDIDEMTRLKVEVLSAQTAETREAAYKELFFMIYRLQGNKAPEGSEAEALMNYVKSAASFPAHATAEASGWTTKKTPLGKFGHVEKIGNGPVPLILIPNQEGWDVYKSFMMAHASEFEMYAVTLPGFGGTAPPPQPELMDLGRLAWWQDAEQAILNLIAGEKLDRPIVVGVMFGAYLAARVALNHPEKVRGAVMINGLVYANDQMSLTSRCALARQGIAAFPSTELIPWSRRPSANAVRLAIEKNPQALVQITNWARDIEKAKTLVVNATTANHPLVARYGSELAATDLSSDLLNLKVPLLVIPAISDKDAPYQGKLALTQFEEVKKAAPSISLTIKPFREVRQYVLFEAEAELGNAIKSFASEIARPNSQQAKKAGDSMKNQVGMEFVYIPAGEFVMGSDTGTDDQKPAHKVKITNPFYLGKYEVTVGQFRKFVEATNYVTDAERQGWGNAWNGKEFTQMKVTWRDPAFSQTDEHPVVMVSYNDAAAFAKWIGGRLPTEAEWEYAARAGSSGDFSGDLDSVAWHKGNLKPEDRTQAVGKKMPNAWGLYDMFGNAWERIEDYYDKAYYQNSPAVNPVGPTTAELKGNRGGGWFSNARKDWFSFRGWGGANNRDPVLGFRIALTIQ